LRLFSFGGYGLALAALGLVVFGAYDSYPNYYREIIVGNRKRFQKNFLSLGIHISVDLSNLWRLIYISKQYHYLFLV